MKNNIIKFFIVIFVFFLCLFIGKHQASYAIYRSVLNTDIYLSILEPAGSYTVTFHSEGGSNVNPMVRTYNEEIGPLPSPDRPGYNFVGWYTEDGNTKITAETKVTEDIDYYAHWAKLVCKNAEEGTLHTETCKSGGGCLRHNYARGNTITYGTIPTVSSPLSGDAYDCDVNNDGIYSPTTERFYFVRENTDNTDNAVLVHYTSFDEDGQMDSSASGQHYQYEEGKNYLPDSTIWTNPALTDFSGKVSRYINEQDLLSACGDPIEKNNVNYLKSCNYFMENSQYQSNTVSRAGIWVDKINNSLFRFQSATAVVQNPDNPTSVNTVRPVIEIPFNTIEGYRERSSYHVTFHTLGGSSVSSLTRYENQPIGELPKTYKDGYKFMGWYLDSDYDELADPEDLVTGNISLYANWKPITLDYVFHIPGTCTFGGASTNITSSYDNCISTINPTNNPIDYTATANKFIDTGISLYSSENMDKDYEIGFIIDNYVSGDNIYRATLMNTKLEKTGYPGVVFRKYDDTNYFLTQARRTSEMNNEYIIPASNVTNVKIYRVGGDIFYKINNGSKILLSQPIYNPVFDLTTWFGASPTDEYATSSQRHFSGTLSNMYIKLETKATVQHTVTFESDGGELSYSSVDIDDGSSIGELPTATKTGFYFDGWYTQSGVKVDGTETINSDTTYYAHWKEIYIVTFLTYGGDLSIVSNSIEVIDGDKIPELPTAIKPNNIFDGWYSEETGGIKYQGNETITSDETYHAHWIAGSGEERTVTFMDDDNTTVLDTAHVIDANVLGSSMIDNPTKQDYVFEGWYINGNISKPFTSSTVVAGGDITVVARWKEKVSIATITTNPSPLNIKVGGTGQILLTATGGGLVENYTCLSSDTTIVRVENNNVYGEGLGSATITVVGSESGETRTISVDVTNLNTITFDPNNGDAITTIEVTYGSSIGDLLPEDPTKQDYIFDRWYYYDGNELTSVPVDITKPVTSDEYYKARWADSNMVAAIGTDYYSTLGEAFTNVPVGTSSATEVRILRDYTILSTEANSARPTVPSGKSVIINGGNHTVTCYQNNVIYNQGITRIVSGTFTCGYNKKGPIENNTNAILYIDGGTISNTYNRGAIYNKGAVYISGGEITSVASERSTVQNVESGSSITMTGGTVKQTSANCNSGALENVSGGTIIVTGGTIISNSTNSAAGGIKNVTGGTLRIGTKDNTHNVSALTIRGMKYGVNSSIDFAFFDGLIEGKDGAVNSGITVNSETGFQKVDNETEVIDGVTYQKLYYVDP